MYHVVAATTNPAKIKAIQLAFDDTFGAGQCRIEPLDVASGVSLQPIGNAETRTGARQRVMEARQVRPEADFWVGVEAGIEDNMTFAWMTIENPHTRGESRSASLMLPETILQGIRAGRELGSEMADISGNAEVKRQGGAIGFFTDGRLSRTSVYQQALMLALVPFINPIYQNHIASSPNQ
ncbi:inosine/xanthosine triphosphatase [Serratia odorifera]|jgi:inosine/xanthosine triphosphatase|uniref:Inosine/xanthosine triphosphatase n=2 Tax=Serratia odorifera TaxID=618 RepID=D4DXE8_SEROD|nr:inosine/xanthosine triphosphatase [Serratia odorifera]EFE97691.1 inosine/xanthosine triphosphatase [Serratia odorifera DSM 4582]MBJ2065322.1 inosine/xanthosine triphosphatase [Serratia odorifera]PNK92213.1 non-canonical purine NTP phosphatase [Serratia odorifera]RII73443.1 non-canonical purine NTP phosphatase [Serratia odorifera]VDZ52828.1 Non-canonical purine NTP phosphatase [Serratia odorifera]